jgi:hypothetical protein
VDLDAYGHVLPKATRQQLNKEQALYRRIMRELRRDLSLIQESS